MAKKRKVSNNTKKKHNGPTLQDRLPKNEKERLELILKLTERAFKHDDGTMARQAERLREKISQLG